MEKYINNYNNQVYKDYLNRLQIFYDYKLKILKKPDVEGLYYKEDENKYELKYNNMSLILTKPKYKDVFKEIEKVKDETSGSQNKTIKNYLYDNSWKEEIDEFADCIINDKSITYGNSLDALKVMEMIINIYRADKIWWEFFNQKSKGEKRE